MHECCLPKVFWVCLSPKVVLPDLSPVEVSPDTSTGTFAKDPIRGQIWPAWRLACQMTVIKPLFSLLRRCACTGWLIWLNCLITSFQGSWSRSRILTLTIKTNSVAAGKNILSCQSFDTQGKTKTKTKTAPITRMKPPATRITICTFLQRPPYGSSRAISPRPWLWPDWVFLTMS